MIFSYPFGLLSGLEENHVFNSNEVLLFVGREEFAICILNKKHLFIIVYKLCFYLLF